MHGGLLRYPRRHAYLLHPVIVLNNVLMVADAVLKMLLTKCFQPLTRKVCTGIAMAHLMRLGTVAKTMAACCAGRCHQIGQTAVAILWIGLTGSAE